ncbi:MAG: hypothetical protein DCC55_15525 [Chloroflexi bacterium]|nr:MAG: hypothetical protein DCC55_15525 [Chloroflexota bacterium]
MRVGDWAKNFGVRVVPSEQRPDNPPGDIVYRVKDIFTTRDGSWEPSDQPGARPQWARDTYLRPWGAPDYFDDAGGDHNLFARVLDLDGQPVKRQDLIICWSDGLHLLGRPDFDQFIKMTMTPKEKSGWGNQPIWNSFSPERGEVGAWCWCPRGAVDVVVGGGLPNNWHVSWFAVWQAERRQGGVVVTPDGDNGSTTPVLPPGDLLDTVRSQVWAAAHIVYNRDSSFAVYARVHNLGAPLTNEINIGGYRTQGFAQGIVYAPTGQWQSINHTSW